MERKIMMDDVFGEMTYKYNWVKTDDIELWEKKYSIRVIAKAYENQDINEHQRKGYNYLKNNIDEISKSGLDKLIEFYKNQISKDKSNNEIIELVEPKTIIFTQKDKFGILCSCSWDKEHGIAIIINENKIYIGSQDELL